MSSLFLVDAEIAPSLFLLNGPVEGRVIQEWMDRHKWNIPADLIRLWTVAGGGSIFETERVLAPVPLHDGEDEIERLTNWCRLNGMPKGFVVFHEGGWASLRI